MKCLLSASVSTQIRHLEEELSDAKSATTSREADLESALGRIRSLEEQLAALQLENSKSKSELDALQRENENLKVSLPLQATCFEGTLKNDEKFSMSPLRSIVFEGSTKLSPFRCTTLMININILKGTNASQEAEFERLKKKFAQAETTIKEQKNTIEHLRTEVSIYAFKSAYAYIMHTHLFIDVIIQLRWVLLFHTGNRSLKWIQMRQTQWFKYLPRQEVEMSLVEAIILSYAIIREILTYFFTFYPCKIYQWKHFRSWQYQLVSFSGVHQRWNKDRRNLLQKWKLEINCSVRDYKTPTVRRRNKPTIWINLHNRSTLNWTKCARNFRQIPIRLIPFVS